MLNLYEILKENKYFINESQESKSQAKAKKLCMKHGMSDEEAEDFIRTKLRNDITNLRHKDTAKFTLGCTRLFFDKELKDEKSISLINEIIELIAKKHIDDYDQNLNDLSLDELYDDFKDEMDEIESKNKNDVNSKEYSNNGYDIVPINSYEEAQSYYKYLFKDSPWCLTHMPNMWNSYTRNGKNQIYFCLKDGYQDMTPPKQTGNPMDEYGLSMISVIVDEEGKLAYSTTRWNHANHANGDHDLTVQEISDIVGVNFYDTFKPYDGDEERNAGMSYEDYYEEVTNNQRYINEFGDTRFVFSQDLEPYEDERFIATPEQYKFGVIASNGWDEDRTITDFSYSMEDSLITNKENFYFIIKDNTNSDLIIYNTYSDDDSYDSYSIEEYDDQFDDTLIFKKYSDDRIIVLKEDKGVIFESENSVREHSIVLENLGNFLQIEENYGNFSLINLDNGNVIVENEMPLNRKEFTSDENGYIQCIEGLYDLNGKLVKGNGRRFTVTEKIYGTNYAYVIDRNGKKNLYNIETQKLIYDNWFKNVSCLNFQNGFKNDKIISVVITNEEYNIAINDNDKKYLLFQFPIRNIVIYFIENKAFFRLENFDKKFNVANEEGTLYFKEWKNNILSVNGSNSKEWVYIDDFNGIQAYVMFNVYEKRTISKPLRTIKQIDKYNFPNNEILLGITLDDKKTFIKRDEEYAVNDNLVFNDVTQLARIKDLYIITKQNNNKNILNLTTQKFMLNKDYENVYFIGYDENVRNRDEVGIVYCNNGNLTDIYTYDYDANFNCILNNLTNFRLMVNSPNVNKLRLIGISDTYAEFTYNNNNFRLRKGMTMVNNNTGEIIDLTNNQNIQTESIKKEFFKKYNLIEKIIKNNNSII